MKKVFLTSIIAVALSPLALSAATYSDTSSGECFFLADGLGNMEKSVVNCWTVTQTATINDVITVGSTVNLSASRSLNSTQYPIGSCTDVSVYGAQPYTGPFVPCTSSTLYTSATFGSGSVNISYGATSGSNSFAAPGSAGTYNLNLSTTLVGMDLAWCNNLFNFGGSIVTPYSATCENGGPLGTSIPITVTATPPTTVNVNFGMYIEKAVHNFFSLLGINRAYAEGSRL